MSIEIDPEGNEIQALGELADFSGKHVLEIGSGDGRLTWRYAEQAGRVTAIEPFAASVEKARAAMPANLKGRVEFHNIGFQDFAAASAGGQYEAVLLSWSLC
jgi:2-polyprenyl-3-methyl-5-hydroxy-6-metoxy-1,4-benzoquinol methylase